jgi:hypothetical protein
LKLDLKETFEKLQQLSLKIQEDLNTMDAPKEDYETKRRRLLQKCERSMEIEKASELKKEEMEKTAEIETQKEEDRDKKLLHLLQQQQQQFQQLNTDNMQQVIAAIPAAAAPNVTSKVTPTKTDSSL